MMLLLSTICLLVTSIYNIDTDLWVITAVSGVSVSLIFPLLFAWVEEEFHHVTAGIAAALTMSCGVGLIISPIIVGLIMKISTVYYSVFLFANSLMVFLHLCTGKILSLKVQDVAPISDNKSVGHVYSVMCILSYVYCHVYIDI